MTTNNKVKPIKKQNTMKNYRNNILKAIEQTDKIKLHSDFNKSIQIISSYPLLVQYIKLSDITIDWFDSMYTNTQDIEIKEMRDRFLTESISNLSMYLINGDDNGLKPLVEGLIDSLSRMIIRKKK